MGIHYNPALHEEPRNQPITVVPPSTRESLFSWLESTGRFQTYDTDEVQEGKASENLDDLLELDNYVVESDEEFDPEK